MTPLLEVRGLHVEVEGKPILKGVDLAIQKGEVHALMGPNGSGKSTLSNTLMGHPKYRVTQGTLLYEGRDITGLSADERARAGIFLAFQYPTAIPGLSVTNFLRTVLKSIRGADVPVKDFRKELKDKMELLEMKGSFAGRYVNDGFSGGEKKRLEILQMALIRPRCAILDETDSGLDIDALKVVSEGINRLRSPGIGMLLITHYQRLLNYVQPDFVHVLVEGRVEHSGGKELALELESKGYDWIEEKAR
ncbi:MAG: Fe-S cluster assembly ATPase SufC [Elusimicrobia bacterium RIFCSPHIGHO2_01_FULL_64_10]|nr:MAG: Fe-S cluster assembly ATPase SufC [Elusimicrobia bacterium RIFCSPHIGHO2_01_FULL_64_10]